MPSDPSEKSHNMGERLENLEKSWLEGQESFKYKVRVTRGNSPPPPDNADVPPSVTAADAWSAHQQQQLMYGQVQQMAPQIDGQATQMHHLGQQQPSIRAFQQNMYAPYNVHQQHSQLQQEFLQQEKGGARHDPQGPLFSTTTSSNPVAGKYFSFSLAPSSTTSCC